MSHRTILPLLSLFALLLVSSCREDNVFADSPAQRTSNYKQELRHTLMAAPHGWAMTYFPRVDSLLFRSATARVEDTQTGPERFGYGGYLFTIKFSSDNQLEMKTDLEGYETQKVYPGEYDIRLGSSLQLSFTTFTPLHELVNRELGGVSDFVYRYTDMQGRLIFTTGVSGLTNRPYILLTPLRSDEAWREVTTKAQEHRRFFEAMEHPQIQIRRGSRLFFQSDVPFKDARGDLSRQRERNRKRYHLFRAYRQRHDILFRGGYNAIGSGYIGTAEGISFRPGFAYDAKAVFYDFERVGDKFVCELVSIYDTQLQRFVLVSKHLHPEGEQTNLIAEIADIKQ